MTSEVAIYLSRILRNVQWTNQSQNIKVKYDFFDVEKKEKKSELNNFDKIVSGNFKKKIDDTPYLTV